MRPESDLRSSGRNSFVTDTAPKRLVSNVSLNRRRSSGRSESPAVASGRTPALLTRMSIRPWRCSTRLTAAWMLAVELTSRASESASRPSLRSAAAASSPRAPSRAPTITFAPERPSPRAVAKPSPRFAPVITATFVMAASCRSDGVAAHAATQSCNAARAGNVSGAVLPPVGSEAALGAHITDRAFARRLGVLQ